MIPIYFHKYHAFGNAYTVIPDWPKQISLTTAGIQTLCHSAYGLGGDGLLIPPKSVETNTDRFPIRIYNPDGSEAEKSGNGPSIFAAYLHQTTAALPPMFAIMIEQAEVIVHNHQTQPDHSIAITVDMGAPIYFPPIQLKVDDQLLTAYPISMGNPHCVIFGRFSADQVAYYGPLIETDPAFPNRTNVQFVEVQDQQNIALQIWERGAGYTLASGSSACATFAACHQLGLVNPAVNLHMPGGVLPAQLTPNNHIVIQNKVQPIANGRVYLPTEPIIK